MNDAERKKILLVSLLLGSLLGFERNLNSQNRDTPEVTRFFQKIGKIEGLPEYWVEYKPCLSWEHCFVQVTVPNERTVEKIKRGERDSVQTIPYYQWKVGEGMTLDEIGDVDGSVQSSLPNAD
jgi:hypothetical protein